MTKPLHVGLGARNGVLAAKLAARRLHGERESDRRRPLDFTKCCDQDAPINEPAIEELGRSYALVTDGLRIKPLSLRRAHPSSDRCGARVQSPNTA